MSTYKTRLDIKRAYNKALSLGFINESNESPKSWNKVEIWTCNHQHSTNRTLQSLKKIKYKCPICNKGQKDNQDEIKKFTQLGDNKWRCSKNHVFIANYKEVATNKFECPYCEIIKKGEESRKALKHATNKGLVSYSGSPADLNSQRTWICSNGHSFNCSLKELRYTKYKCPQCEEVKLKVQLESHNIKTFKETESVDEINRVVEQYGLKCEVSVGYQNKSLLFKSVSGNEFRARWNTLKDTIKRMRKLASNNGGSLISIDRIRKDYKYSWRCSEFHESSGSYEQASLDWCKECYIKKNY